MLFLYRQKKKAIGNVEKWCILVCVHETPLFNSRDGTYKKRKKEILEMATNFIHI